MKKRLAAVVGVMALGLFSSVSPATAAADDSVGVLINQRTCKTESPRQIVLVHSSGSITCYGGTVGRLSLNGRYVQTVHAGGYHGAIGWSNGSSGGHIILEPGAVEVVGRNCTWLEIRPAS
ncbi:hypothetical protein [Plantactinospora veratri]|uniref:hypothetical protein n=1 Tax=Plantactinospora veratri TaxID=1436122 RepID=UPI002F26997B